MSVYNGIEQVISIPDVNIDGKPDLFIWMNLLRLSAGYPGTVENGWLEVDLVGTVSNRSAVGAKAVLHAAGVTAMAVVSGSQPGPGRIHFGLEEEQADSIVVFWPSGIIQVERDLPFDALIEIEEDSTLVSVRNVARCPGVPARSRLYQNYPNPFNPSTVISYDLPDKPGEGYRIRLDIYDLRGRRVRRLLEAEQDQGIHHVVWDGRNDDGGVAGSGIYLYKLTVDETDVVKKMILSR
jgi:hypothetical protein